MSELGSVSSPKKKFVVTIEEHISGNFVVYADDLEEAIRITETKYKNGKFVVDSSVPTSCLMMVQCEDSDAVTEWREF